MHNIFGLYRRKLWRNLSKGKEEREETEKGGLLAQKEAYSLIKILSFSTTKVGGEGEQ
jgi:hypothetical protein